ncbi:MAG TPA: hypothetical protein VGI39_01285 [Polyangiaceae bacterium]|jgi:hypothetical protein
MSTPRRRLPDSRKTTTMRSTNSARQMPSLSSSEDSEDRRLLTWRGRLEWAISHVGISKTKASLLAGKSKGHVASVIAEDIDEPGVQWLLDVCRKSVPEVNEYWIITGRGDRLARRPEKMPEALNRALATRGRIPPSIVAAADAFAFEQGDQEKMTQEDWDLVLNVFASAHQYVRGIFSGAPSRGRADPDIEAIANRTDPSRRLLPPTPTKA